MIFDIRRETDLTILGKNTFGRVGATTGTFDMFHEMHRSFLERCRRKCDFLLVGVGSDDLVKETKGPDRPIVPEHQRVTLVASMSAVGGAFILGSLQDLSTLIDRAHVSHIFRNQDWRNREKEVIGSDRAEVVIIPDSLQMNSTTDIISRVLSQPRSHAAYKTTGPRRGGDPICFGREWEDGTTQGARECRMCPSEPRCKPAVTQG